MINIIKKRKVYIPAIILIIIILGIVILSNRGDKQKFDTAVAQRIDLTQEVSVTGRVKPAQSVELAFEKGGKISAVYTDVGKQVFAGQLLIVLGNSELAAQLSQAQAGVESAQAQLAQYQAALETQQAKLEELKLGTRPEEVQVQETKVTNAKTSLEDAKKNLIVQIQDAYTKSDDAIRNKIDQFFLNPKGANPQLTFFTDSQLESDIESKRLLIESTLKSWQTSLETISTSSDLESHLDTAKTNLIQTKNLLEKSALAVNGLLPNSSISQTTIDAYKSDVSTGRTNINTATVNLTTAEEKLRTAESILKLEQDNLALTKAEATVEQITAQEAQVKQAEANVLSQQAQIKQAKANVNNYFAQISKTVIRAPINGTITKQEAKVGEIVSANTVIVSLMSASQFEIEANVPEADIAKVNVGNDAKTTLDAYGNDVVFGVKVVAIDPAETIIDGVATYKVTFQFIETDERIKSGMTANIDISTEKRENVIAVPQRAVVTKNGEKYVRVLTGEETKEIKVKTGMRDSYGNIEILEGINDGDTVVITFE
ncbi:efflux RND transporter periplasmic adaptor subunit [Candidatus Uhrbacteria bacterium]|nr:efflux RND transporter periplasmic adaptor subunit [Candidatus Uhrbacteria bacterium]